MADLNFPNNPTEGQTWTDPNGVVWKFSGYGWKEFDPPTLQSMTDVSGNTPNVGDKLIWDGDNWTPQERLIRFDEFTDVSGTPVTDGYLVYDGTNFNPSGNDNALYYCQYRTNNGSELIGYDGTMSFEQVVIDTHNQATNNNERITIASAGMYKVTGIMCLSDGMAPIEQAPPYEMYIISKNSSGVQKYRYEARHQGSVSSYFIDAYIICHMTYYETYNVGDYIYMDWVAHDVTRTNPVYPKNVSLSAHKINKVL